MTQEPNYYDLLGVSRNADSTEIKAAFRAQALRNHPDQGGNPVLFRMLEAAYETLISPSKREEYDVWLASVGGGTPPRGVVIPQYLRDEWDASSPVYVNDREPVPDTPPVFLRDSGPPYSPYSPADGTAQAEAAAASAWQGPSEPPLYDRPHSHHSLVMFELIARWVRNVAIVWIIVASLLGLRILPGVENKTVYGVLIMFVLFWIFGSLMLRLGGWLLAILTLVEAYNGHAPPIVTIEHLALAFAIWLVGQWFYTFRSGKFNSAVAFGLMHKLPGYMRPDYRFLRAGISDLG